MPDYSKTAVTIYVDKGYGDGLWRNQCPIDCGWHSSEWTVRGDAVTALNGEKDQHLCLRAPHPATLEYLDEAADLLRQARSCSDGEAHDRLVQIADGLIRIAALTRGALPPEPRESGRADG